MSSQQKNESFGKRLNWLMDQCGITALKLSRELNVSHVAVGNWKKGSLPYPATLKELADWMGCSVDYLLHGTGDPPEFITGKQPLDWPGKKVHSGRVTKAEANTYTVDPWVAWSKQLRAAYRRDPAKIELAVRAAWPEKTAGEILAWLSNPKP